MIKGLYEKDDIIAIITVIILGLMLIIFVIKPSATGYATYQKIKSLNYTLEDYGKDIQELKSELLISDTNLSSCDAFSKKLLAELEKYSDKFSECKSELGALEIDFNFSKSQYEEIIKDLKADLDKKEEELKELKYEKEKEINDLELKYGLFVKNTANNICCKAKVDNPDINYYRIENNKIICLEEGTLSISC